MCNKQSYSKREAATIVNHVRSGKSQRNRRERRYYQCPQCGRYHLTSKG